MEGGRSRWHIENQVFNTLKNQDYEFEHNYGHGEQSLSTVFAMLMMLAFLIDQVQEYGCTFFQAAHQRFHSRTSLWIKIKGLFTEFFIDTLGIALACDYLWTLQVDSYNPIPLRFLIACRYVRFL